MFNIELQYHLQGYQHWLNLPPIVIGVDQLSERRFQIVGDYKGRGVRKHIVVMLIKMVRKLIFYDVISISISLDF
jgi:hypothetical protein